MSVVDKLIFCLFLFIRLVSVSLVLSFFVPDEYWQSLEVSHKLTFGYGHRTWEWGKKIRSYFYPFIIHLWYKVVPDSSFFISQSPRVLQAVLSAVGDFFAYRLATEYFGKECGVLTAFNITLSWFLFYCSSRTLTNMAEASLTSCGLYFYPWPLRGKYRSSSKYIWFAAISAVIRPTAVVIWFPLYIWHIFKERHLYLLLKNTFQIGLTVLAGMLLVDKHCYGDWVFTPYNFFQFNWKSDIGAFYGSHSFFWYFLVGLPAVLGLQIIPFIFGLFLPQLRQFNLMILWVLIIFSIPSHKEFRFLLPIMHMCMIICGVVMNEIYHQNIIMRRIGIKREFLYIFVPLLCLFHGLVSLYMGIFHQSGVIQASIHLSETVNSGSSVLFLMPCHSTPYYSYIHQNVKMKFLSCEPNFDNNSSYVEEADEFFANPSEWLSKNYESDNSSSLPSDIVLFDTLYHNVSTFLKKHHYQKCFSTFHSHFAQGRTGNSVFIYCK